MNEAIVFYPKFRKFLKKNLQEKELNILDVGANKDQSIDFFKSIYSNININAFEPNKKLFTYLQSKYNNQKSIYLHNVGVSKMKGELVFHENILDETSTFEELNLESKYLDKKAKILEVTKEKIIVDTYKVNVIRLSDFFKRKSK